METKNDIYEAEQLSLNLREANEETRTLTEEEFIDLLAIALS